MEETTTGIDNEIVMDSLNSEVEEHQPLGNLLEIFCMKNNSDIDEADKQDSDETCLDEGSPQLAAFNECLLFGQGEIIDDDTCLSSNLGTPPLMPSQISLFSTQRNNSTTSVEKSITLACSDNIIAKDDISSTNTIKSDFTSLSHNNEVLKSIPNQPTRQLSTKRKRKRCKKKKMNWSNQRCMSQSHISSSQSLTKSLSRKPYHETHCFHMEEINVIESKLSSVEKLLSTKMRQYVEQAHLMMKKDVIERIEKIKNAENEKDSFSYSSSDIESEEEQEVNRLIEVKQTRLRKVVVHQEVVMQKLNKELNKSFDDESDDNEVAASQSILPSAVRGRNSMQMSRPYRLRKTGRGKILAKMSDLIQPPNLKPNDSIIYIPVISSSNATSKLGRCNMTSRMTYTSLTKSPNVVCIKEVTVTTPKSLSRGGSGVLGQIGKQKIPTSSVIPSLSTYQAPSLPSTFHGATSPNLTLVQSIPNAYSKPPKQFRHPLGQSQPCSVTPLPPQSRFENSQSHLSSHPVVQSQSSIPRHSTEPMCSCLDLCDMLKAGLISRGTNVLSFSASNLSCLASLVGNGLILSHDHQIYVSPMTWLKAITSKYYPRVSAYKKIFYQGTSLFDLSNNRSTSTSKVICGTGQQSIHSTVQSTTSTIHLMDSTPNTSKTQNYVTRDAAYAYTQQPNQFLSKRNCTGLQSAGNNAIQCIAGNQINKNSVKPVFLDFHRCKIRLVKDDEFFLPSSLFSRNPCSEDELHWHLLNDGW